MKNKLLTAILSCSFLVGVAYAGTMLNQDEDLVESAYDRLQLNQGVDVKKAMIGDTEGVSYSRTYAQYGKNETTNRYALRFSTAVKGDIESLNYVRYGYDVEKKVTPVTTVYKGIKAGDKVYYYDGKDITTDDSYAGQYYWACYTIEFNENSNMMDTNFVAQLEIKTSEKTEISEAKSSSLSGLKNLDENKDQYPYNVSLIQREKERGAWFGIVIDWTDIDYKVSDINAVKMSYTFGDNQSVEENLIAVNNKVESNDYRLAINRAFNGASYIDNECKFFMEIINDAGKKYNISFDFFGSNFGIGTIMPSKGLVSSVEELAKYKVTFDANYLEAEAIDTILDVTNGLTYGELPHVERDGHRFLGWYTDKNDGDLITSGTIVDLSSDITLYAHWEAEQIFNLFIGGGGGAWVPVVISWTDDNYDLVTDHNKISVTFVINGSEMKEAGHIDNCYVNNDSNEARVGSSMPSADFRGANLQFTAKIELETLNGEFYLITAEVNHNADVFTILSLNVEQIIYEEVEINFDANDGQFINQEDKVRRYTKNKAFNSLPEVKRDEYVFDGWYTELDSGERITENSICQLDDGATLYAHWTSKADAPVYNVEIVHADGGAWFRVKLSWFDDAQDITTYNDIEVSLTRPDGNKQNFNGFMDQRTDNNDENYAVFGCGFVGADFIFVEYNTLELKVTTTSGEVYLVTCTIIPINNGKSYDVTDIKTSLQ